MKLERGTCLGQALALALVLVVVETTQASPAIYRRTLASTGWVVVPGPEGLGSGTCWLADRESRLVVTCQHVVGKASDVLVYFPSLDSGRPVVEAIRYLRGTPSVAGRVIASDPVRDLAVVRLAELPGGVEVLPLAESSSGPGDEVHCIGNSGVNEGLGEGSLWWYMRGTVRQVQRKRVRMPGGERSVWIVQTQAPVNEGDSGGPVVNDEGRLIGVTSSYARGQRLVSQNIDVREVRAFLAETRGRPDPKEEADKTGPLGSWKFHAEGKDGKALAGEGEFRRDGTFLMSRPKGNLAGRYAYANGVLCLIVDEGLATLKPAWQGDDRFCVRLGGAELIFDRRLTTRAGRLPCER